MVQKCTYLFSQPLKVFGIFLLLFSYLVASFAFVLTRYFMYLLRTLQVKPYNKKERSRAQETICCVHYAVYSANNSKYRDHKCQHMKCESMCLCACDDDDDDDALLQLKGENTKPRPSKHIRSTAKCLVSRFIGLYNGTNGIARCVRLCVNASALMHKNGRAS